MENIHVSGGAKLDKDLVGYSDIFFTDMTRTLNEMYCINEAEVNVLTLNTPLLVLKGDLRVPMTEETFRKLNGAEIIHAASHNEVNYIVSHYLNFVKRLGQFAALPYDEISIAAQEPQSSVDMAARDPFFRVGYYANNGGRKFLELTDRLFPIN